MAVLAGRHHRPPLLFDIRGFWADERVEGAIWPAGGLLYRTAKRCEQTFYRRADAIVTLTEASVPQIQDWTRGRDVPIVVIPTCVDVERFDDRPLRPGGPNAVWSGSIGTWYRFDLVAPLVRALQLPLTVLTRQRDLAERALNGLPASIISRPPEDVPNELYAGDIGLCLIKSSFSKTASAPTRLAEYLAAGMAVIVTPQVGDLEALVEEHGVGVVLRGEDEAALIRAADAMRELAGDPELPERCRKVASHRFAVEIGSRRYAELYRDLATFGRQI
jgi:glycosyltransferase involved in cell wall biosynthesis